jgi:hypothetical protein
VEVKWNSHLVHIFTSNASVQAMAILDQPDIALMKEGCLHADFHDQHGRVSVNSQKY